MSIFLRLTLLSLFAATGAAIAIGIALSTGAPSLATSHDASAQASASTLAAATSPASAQAGADSPPTASSADQQVRTTTGSHVSSTRESSSDSKATRDEHSAARWQAVAPDLALNAQATSTPTLRLVVPPLAEGPPKPARRPKASEGVKLKPAKSPNWKARAVGAKPDGSPAATGSARTSANGEAEAGGEVEAGEPAPTHQAPRPAVTQQIPANVFDQDLSKLMTAEGQAQLKAALQAAVGDPEELTGPILNNEPLLRREKLPPPPGAKDAPPAPRAPPRIKPRITRVPGEGDDRLSIHIQDTDIREVLELMSEQGGLNILPSNNVQGKVSASLSDVDIDTALRAILRSTGYMVRHDGKFIYVGTAADFQNLEHALDRINTRVYRPNYVRAQDIQAMVTPLLTQGVGTISVSAPSEVGIGTDGAKAGGDNFAGSDAILVRDYEAVLVQVDQVMAEIDRRPLQVAIEAMVLSVKLDNDNQYGVDFQLLRNKRNLRLATNAPLANIADVSFNDGLKFGFLDSSLGVFLDALETIGDTDVIATPRLMCLNKHRAEILIGAQLGYVSSTVTETSTSQSVQFLEVGTQLRLRPFISNDGMIRMEVHPELSTGTVEVRGDFTLPEKEVTQVTTNIMTRDGCTVIIGGLMREDLTTNTTQVPFLGSVPVVGWLFKHKNETMQRREILVLITPHIVYEPETCAEGDKGACQFHERHENFKDHMSPIGRRYLSRKYHRLAEQAMLAGKRNDAVRYIGLAVQFDPSSRASLELRTKIEASNALAARGGPGPAVRLGPTLVAEGEVLPALESKPNAPLQAWEPVRPGRAITIQRPEQLKP